MKDTLISIKEYAGKNILRFLLLAVILTLCFAMRYAAMGKYVTYMQEETQAIAGESFFSSNYLSEYDGVNCGLSDLPRFTISSWNKKEYTIAMDLQNYNNSYKYNSQTCQNMFVYLEADILDEDGNEWPGIFNDYPNMTLTVSYGENGNEFDGYYTDAALKCHKVLLLPGGSQVLRKANVTLKVDTLNSENKIDDDFFIRVKAKMVPLSSYGAISLAGSVDASKRNNASSLFQTQLGACFYMGNIESNADIDQSIRHTEGDYPVIAEATCTMNNQTSVKVRLYFNSDNVDGSDKKLTVHTVTTQQDIDERNEILPDEIYTTAEMKAALDCYYEEILYPGKPLTYRFLKWDPTRFEETDLYFGVKKDTE